MHTADWFDEYEWHTRSERDEGRVALAMLHRETYRFGASDPDHSLELIDQVRVLADRFREP